MLLKDKTMTNEDLIQAKSNEIRRLHNVCNNKDEAIRSLIALSETLLSDTTGKHISDEFRETARKIINRLKDSIG